ncbi:spindle and kinetochore-associated protein 2-like [Mytilus trossulus]|uniref:spindle and kinetochore-associated protein 2-like n=1 Tax=Mytilus trossulus TaxID=6551 RepID=UPI0030077340
MEKNVEILESMFQQAESDLNYLSRKIEFEFDKDNEENKVNPAKMLQKIQDIKKEYGSLVKEAAAIQQVQKEAADYFKTQIQTVCKLLEDLQQKTGKSDNERPQELDKIEEILGVKIPTGCEIQGPSGDQKDTGEEEENHTYTIDSKNNTEEENTAGAESCLSPAELRSGTCEFIEITESEFDTVSTLIKGRVKLLEVNMVYRILWRHFKEEENKSPLSTGEMNKMGLKVFGSTGEAKLKVLRALKLLTISRNKDVQLV